METKRVARRRHSAELRAEVVLACRQPGASVAAIALRSGLNANVVLVGPDGVGESMLACNPGQPWPSRRSVEKFQNLAMYPPIQGRQ